MGLNVTQQTMSIEAAISSIRHHSPETQVERLIDLVSDTIRTMDRELMAMRKALLDEVQALGSTVSAARDEIAKLKADKDFGVSPIPGATDELDAIVDHTAAATETILTACEALDEFAGGLAEAECSFIQAHTMQVFEACSFQDITGQRISKVVAALKLIEARIERIAGTYGVSEADPAEQARDPLLNGPQAPHAAMDQAEIDKLLTF